MVDHFNHQNHLCPGTSQHEDEVKGMMPILLRAMAGPPITKDRLITHIMTTLFHLRIK